RVRITVLQAQADKRVLACKDRFVRIGNAHVTGLRSTSWGIVPVLNQRTGPVCGCLAISAFDSRSPHSCYGVGATRPRCSPDRSKVNLQQIWLVCAPHIAAVPRRYV